MASEDLMQEDMFRQIGRGRNEDMDYYEQTQSDILFREGERRKNVTTDKFRDLGCAIMTPLRHFGLHFHLKSIQTL